MRSTFLLKTFVLFSAFALHSANAVTLQSCKVDLKIFRALSCSGGSVIHLPGGGTANVPVQCVGNYRPAGTMVVNLDFDPTTYKGTGNGFIIPLSTGYQEDFKLQCGFSKGSEPSPHIDCVSNVGIVGVEDKRILLRFRAQPLENGSHVIFAYFVGAYGTAGNFSSVLSCQK